jgi:hypothetical protein
MSWGEALRLVERLAADPSSHVAAALQKWSRPVSAEALVLMDLFDLQHKVAAGKKSTKPYPRPWHAANVRHHGGTARLSAPQLRALFAAHTEPDVTPPSDASAST